MLMWLVNMDFAAGTVEVPIVYLVMTSQNNLTGDVVGIGTS